MLQIDAVKKDYLDSRQPLKTALRSLRIDLLDNPIIQTGYLLQREIDQREEHNIRCYQLLKEAVFAKEGERYTPVTLPHTWNAMDGQDGGGDFWRGVECGVWLDLLDYNFVLIEKA